MRRDDVGAEDARERSGACRRSRDRGLSRCGRPHDRRVGEDPVELIVIFPEAGVMLIPAPAVN